MDVRREQIAVIYLHPALPLFCLVAIQENWARRVELDAQTELSADKYAGVLKLTHPATSVRKIDRDQDIRAPVTRGRQAGRKFDLTGCCQLYVALFGLRTD